MFKGAGNRPTSDRVSDEEGSPQMAGARCSASQAVGVPQLLPCGVCFRQINNKLRSRKAVTPTSRLLVPSDGTPQRSREGLGQVFRMSPSGVLPFMRRPGGVGAVSSSR